MNKSKANDENTLSILCGTVKYTSKSKMGIKCEKVPKASQDVNSQIEKLIGLEGNNFESKRVLDWGLAISIANSGTRNRLIESDLGKFIRGYMDSVAVSSGSANSASKDNVESNPARPRFTRLLPTANKKNTVLHAPTAKVLSDLFKPLTNAQLMAAYRLGIPPNYFKAMINKVNKSKKEAEQANALNKMLNNEAIKSRRVLKAKGGINNIATDTDTGSSSNSNAHGTPGGTGIAHKRAPKSPPVGGATRNGPMRSMSLPPRTANTPGNALKRTVSMPSGANNTRRIARRRGDNGKANAASMPARGGAKPRTGNRPGGNANVANNTITVKPGFSKWFEEFEENVKKVLKNIMNFYDLLDNLFKENYMKKIFNEKAIKTILTVIYVGLQELKELHVELAAIIEQYDTQKNVGIFIDKLRNAFTKATNGAPEIGKLMGMVMCTKWYEQKYHTLTRNDRKMDLKFMIKYHSKLAKDLNKSAYPDIEHGQGTRLQKQTSAQLMDIQMIQIPQIVTRSPLHIKEMMKHLNPEAQPYYDKLKESVEKFSHAVNLYVDTVTRCEHNGPVVVQLHRAELKQKYARMTNNIVKTYHLESNMKNPKVERRVGDFVAKLVSAYPDNTPVNTILHNLKQRTGKSTKRDVLKLIYDYRRSANRVPISKFRKSI